MFLTFPVLLSAEHVKCSEQRSEHELPVRLSTDESFTFMQMKFHLIKVVRICIVNKRQKIMLGLN